MHANLVGLTGPLNELAQVETAMLLFRPVKVVLLMPRSRQIATIGEAAFDLLRSVGYLLHTASSSVDPLCGGVMTEDNPRSCVSG